MTASTLPRWTGDTEPEFILQLARSLSECYDVTVLAPHCPGAQVEDTVDGVHIHRFRYAPEAWESLAYQGGMLWRLKQNPLRWLLLPAFLLGQLWAIRRLEKSRRFDLLHVHWIIPQGLVAMLARWVGIYRGPMLLTSHGGDLFSLQRFDTLKKKILQHMDGVNVVSRAMVPVCRELGVSEARVAVRSMGVDLRNRFVNTTPWQERAGIVFVGRLVEKKGVDVLVRAIAILAGERDGLSVSVAGDGPLRGSLQQLAGELGCAGNIEFLGAIPNRELPTLLNRHKIAVVPSVVAADGDQEGLGLVAVEAMGCGCAVLCSDLPALEDVVENGVSGRVFPAGDAQALAEGLQALLDADDEAARLAQAGHQTAVESFDWRSVSRDYQRIYGELLERAGGRADLR